jgi:hypothetical protein
MHRIEEPTCVGLVPEAHDHIVGVAHDDHVAGAWPAGPAGSAGVMLARSGEATESTYEPKKDGSSPQSRRTPLLVDQAD